jgi:hypothetical protein
MAPFRKDLSVDFSTKTSPASPPAFEPPNLSCVHLFISFTSNNPFSEIKKNLLQARMLPPRLFEANDTCGWYHAGGVRPNCLLSNLGLKSMKR